MTNTLLEAALDYAARGWRVFPLKPRGKTPLVKGGFKVATVAPAQIRAWWEKWPDANIGIATGQASGILVLDIDSPEGLAALKRLRELHGELPATMVATTARGWHFYYQLRQGEEIRCSSGEGLDVRGDGGYVVAPPSIHETGAVYAWVAA